LTAGVFRAYIAGVKPVISGLTMSQNGKNGQKSMIPLKEAANTWRKFNAGKVLTLPEAVLANCYTCNGGDSTDCKAAEVCPLYPFGLFGARRVRVRRPKAAKGGE
jgi:hypothetical protein